MKVRSSFALWLFLFALTIRLAFLTATYQDREQVKYWEDVGIAINLFEGKGYVLNFSMMQPAPLRPTACKPPVYPILVFLVFLAFGMKNFFALFVIHAVLSALTCALLYLSIARFSHSKAAIASGVFAVYPPFVHHSVVIPESTTLTLLLISLFCYGLVNLYERFGQKRWIVVSVVGGLLALTEPVTVPFIFLALLHVAYLALDSWKRICLEMVTAVLIFAATIAPWTLRNYVTFNELVFIKSNFGSSLKDSMYRSGIRLPEETEVSLAKVVQGMDEVSEDKAVQQALMSWIFANPVAYLRLLPENFNHFWWETSNYKKDWSPRYIFGRKVPYVALLVLSIFSILWNLVQLGRHGKLQISTNIYHHLMFILIFVYTIVYTAVGAVNLRYHFPVQFGMFIFFADTLIYIINKVRLPSSKSLRWLEASH